MGSEAWSSKPLWSAMHFTTAEQQSRPIPHNTPAQQPESDVDWAALWQRDIALPALSANEIYWSSRAHGVNVMTQRGGYTSELLARIDARPGETVIDMGCSTGMLAVPLALQGNPVIACDFSTAVLTRLEQSSRASGVEDLVEARKLFWFDSWDDLPVADVFVASRPIYARDLPAAILNIEAHARRRCYVTAATRFSVRHDPTMLEAIGRKPPTRSESVYIANMLAQMGRFPEISYVTRNLPAFGESLEEVREEYERQDGPFTPEESVLLDAFIRDHFRVITDSEGLSMLRRTYKRPATWAFISWNPLPKP